MRATALVGICTGVLLLLSTSTAALAEYPAYCRPNAGANLECAAPLLTPYRYTAYGCGTPLYRSSEAEAFRDNGEWFSNGPDYCNRQVTRIGWITEPRPIAPSCGSVRYEPSFLFGHEMSNASTYRYQWESCQTQQPGESVRDEVVRARTYVCPRGYQRLASGVCYRTHLDPTKNSGKPCPPCGNPINAGTGNKYQEELDYQASGSFPLTFRRYYNSHLRTLDIQPGHFHYTDYYNAIGGHAYVQMFIASEDHGGRFSALAMDSMGQNWRHYYQRSIDVAQVTNDGITLTTVYAYRHDGRVLAFNEYNGQYVPPADVVDRLEPLPGGGWRLTAAIGDEIETYSANGHLLRIANRAGEAHTLTYDSGGRLATVTDQAGRTLTFVYDAPIPVPGDTYIIRKVLTPSGSEVSYGYDGLYRLTSVTYPDGSNREYLYENGTFVRAMTGLVDENDVRFATWGYDSYGRANLSEHAGGVGRTTITYAGTLYELATGTRTVSDAFGVSRSYAHTSILGVARLTGITQPAASGSGATSSSITYDANGNVTSRRDFNGGRTCYAYDLARNLETVRLEGLAPGVACPPDLAGYTPPPSTTQRKITTQWHPTYRLPAQIDEPGKRTTFTHDANGNTLTKTILDSDANSSRTWTYSYSTFGQILTEDGPRTDVSDLTTYTYNTCVTGFGCGQLATLTNALGQVTTYNSYDANGRPLSITDPNGVTITLTYNFRGQVTSRTEAGETTSFTYDPVGQLKRVALPDSSYLEYVYDAAHRLTEMRDNLGNKVVYTLDNMGNRTAENAYDPSNALRRTHSRIYSVLNRLHQDVNAAGTAAVTTTYAYDPNGNLTTIAAPMGRNSTNSYDALNRLKQVTDPLSGTTQFAYDATDNLTSVTDPKGLVTGYQYNGFGDVKQLTSPDTGTTANSYDSAGNLVTSTDARGAVATHGYDALNRVTSIAYGDQTITFGYDIGANGTGRLTSASDAGHAMSWTYDSRGRVTGKGQTVGGVPLAVGYGYLAGRLSTLTMPSGAAITYGYDVAGRVSSVAVNGSTVLSNVLYEPFGGTAGWTWGNGTYSVRTHDLDGRITQVDSGGLTTYAYDDAFRITGITDTTDPANSWTYGYDLLDRLTSASSTSVTQGWSFDANGNRLAETGTAPSTYTISSTSNRITSISGSLPRTYAYDAAGNTTGFAGAVFGYDNRGRMTSASYDGVTASYVYNALGQRVKRVLSSGTTLYMYDESGHLLGEYDGSGSLVQETVWLGDIPVATLRPNGASVEVYYVHTDHLNTPRLITQPADDAVRWRWDSDPFGTDLPNENPSGRGAFTYNLRFPGQLYDGVVGLHYNYFRDYDASTGRYVQSDPIGLDGGINTYAYAKSDPLHRVDYFGLEPARLCENYDGLKKGFCDTCVKTVCSLAGASRFCCLVEFNECMFKNDDTHGQLVCSARLEACNLKKSKGPKKPPKDI